MDIYDGQNLDIEANAVITGAEMQSPADFLASYNNSADENVPIGYSQDNLNVIKQQSPLRRLGMTRDTMRFVIDNPDLIKYIGTSEFAPRLMKKIQLATKMQQNRQEAERRRQEWEDSPTVFDGMQVYIPGESREERDARMRAAINTRLTDEQKGKVVFGPDLPGENSEYNQIGLPLAPDGMLDAETMTTLHISTPARSRIDIKEQDRLEQEWNRAYMKQARAQGYSFSDKDWENIRQAKELISSPTGKNSWRLDVNLRNALKKYGDNPLKQAAIVEYAYDLYSRESRLLATLDEHHPYWRDLGREERGRLAGRIADKMGMSTEGMYLDRLDERGIADIQLKQLTNLFHIPEFITRAMHDKYFRHRTYDWVAAVSNRTEDFDYKGVTKYDGVDAVLKKGGAYMAQLDRLRGENAWSTVGDSLLESLRYSAELAILNTMLGGAGEFGDILKAGGFDGGIKNFFSTLGTGKGWLAVGKYLGVNSVTQAVNAFNPLSLFNSYAQAAIESENLPDLMYQDENGETVVMEPKVRDTLMDKFAQNLMKNYISYFSENMGELLPKIKVFSYMSDSAKKKFLTTVMEGAQSPYTWLQKALNAVHFSGFGNELAEEYFEKIAGRAVTYFLGEKAGIRAFDLGEDSFFGDWGEFGTTAAVVALQSLVMGGAGHVGSRIGNRGVGSDVRAVLDASRDIVQAAEDCGISTAETARLIKDTLDRNLKDTKFALKADGDLLDLVRQNPEFFGKLGITEEAVSQKLQNGELVDVNLAALTALQTQSREFRETGEALKNLTLDPQELTRQQQEQREQQVKLEIAYADQRRKALKQSLSDTVGRRLEEIAAEHPEASLDTDTTGGLFNSIIDVISDTFGGEAAEQVAVAMVDRYAQNPSEFESDWNAGRLPTEAEKDAHWKPALAALRKGDLKAMEALASAFGITVDLGTPEKWNEMNQRRRTELVNTASDARTEAQDLRSQAEQARQEGDEAKAQELEKQAAAQEKTASDADAYVKKMDDGKGKVQGYTVKNGKDTRIYINPDTDADVPLFLAFGDELVHYLNAASPETYALIKDAIFPQDGARTPRMQEYLDKLRAIYADLKNEEEFQEEAVSHILGRILSDFDAQLELANAIEERRKGAGRTFLEAVLDTLSKILRWLGKWGGSEGRALFEDYDGVRRKVVSALADYAALRQELDAEESSPDNEANSPDNEANSPDNEANSPDNEANSPDNETEAQAETGTPIDTQGISQAEIDEMHNRIVEWGGDTAAIDWAKGKTLNECIERFGNELEAIAYIPRQYLQYFDGSTSNNRVYSGKAYFIDHIANHGHGDIGAQQFIEMQSMFLEPDEVIKDTRNKPNGAPKDALIFVKRFAKNRMVIIELSEEEGNIVLHKSLYNTKDRVYPGLPRVPGGGRSPISHAGNATPGGSLSARDTGDTIQQNAEGANAEGENSAQPTELPPVTFGLREMPEGEKPQVNDSDPDWYRAAKERGLTFRAWHPKGEEAPSGGVLAIIDLASGEVLFSGDEGYRNEFQPRYESATRDAQIKKMAQDPHALQFFSVDATDKGTPMFAYRDGKLYAISGNGRGKSLREMYRTYHTDAEYRALLRQWAAQNGYRLDEGMREPVLARILPDTMTDRELKMFADFANANATLQATRSESLLKTASEIVNDAEMLSLLHPAKDGSLLTSENMEFFLKFMERYGTVEGDLDERGLPTEAVETRVEKALLASLFLDEADKRQALRTVNELMSRRAADLGISTRVNAVAANMPGVMDMRRRNPAYDISPELGLAMRALLDYAAHRKDFGYPGMFTMQPGIDGNMMPAAVQALFLPLAEAKSFDDVNAIFSGWADSVDAETGGMSALLGEPRTKEQMLEGKRQAFIDAHPEQFRFSVSEDEDEQENKKASNGGKDLRRSFSHSTRKPGSTNVGDMPRITALPSFNALLNIPTLDEKARKAVSALKELAQSAEQGTPVKGFEKPLTVKNLLTSLETAGFNRREPGAASVYQTVNGMTIRVSDHQADAPNFAQDNTQDNLSIVLEKPHTYKDFQADENVPVIEALYLRKHLEGHHELLSAILKDIATAVATGKYHASAPAFDYHFSGTPEQIAQARKNLAIDALENKELEQQLDRIYLRAVKRNDMETAEAMVRARAEAMGYSENSEYQGSLAFNGAAPSSNAYYETKEERAQAFEDGEFEGDYSLGDFIDNGLDGNDLQWQLDNPAAASGGDKATQESISNLANVARKKGRTIKMYRAVDAKIEEGSFRNGDWITPSRKYAEKHIELQDWENGRIIEQEVSIDDIWWNGDDINEWGYDDGNSYAYADTRNNRKLLDPVTYDDAGNVIPLSKRFNKRESDTRYSIPELWTGTAADYEAPSLHYIGTGEGAQVYGWGLYATDNRGIAEWYAEMDADRKTRQVVTYKGKEEYVDSLSNEERTAARLVQASNGNVDEAIEFLEEQTNPHMDAEFAKKVHDILSNGRKDFKLLRTEKPSRNLYRQTWFTNREGEGEANLLDWRGLVSEEQKDAILDALSQETDNKDVISFVNREREDWQTDDDGEIEEEPEYYPSDVLRDYLEQFLDFHEADGKYVYRQIADLLGSEKAASEFLFSAGIDGVKYEAAQSDGSDGWNYVSFSDTNMRVDEHIRYNVSEESLAADGKTTMSGEPVRYSLYDGPEIPEDKQRTVYKLMRLVDGKLQTLFIDRENYELGKWYEADAPDLSYLKDLDAGYAYLVDKDNKIIDKREIKKTGGRISHLPSKSMVEAANASKSRWITVTLDSKGRRKYDNVGINGSEGVTTFAMRPGIHAGSLPVMQQIGAGEWGNLRNDDLVWVRGKIAFDENEARKVRENGGEINDGLPEYGYEKGTSSFVTKGMSWYISRAFKPEEIISDAEAQSVVDDFNANVKEKDAPAMLYDYQRRGDRRFYSDTMRVENRRPDDITDYSRYSQSAAMKGAASKGIAVPQAGPNIWYSILELSNGGSFVLVNNENEFKKINLSDKDSVEAYLLNVLANMPPEGIERIAGNERIRIGDDLPHEYSYGNYSRMLDRKIGRILKAKRKLATALDEAIAVSGERAAEQVKHNKKRENGVYYKRPFTFALQNSWNNDIKVYTADLVSYTIKGEEYLYDVVNIQDAPQDLTRLASQAIAAMHSRDTNDGTYRKTSPEGNGSNIQQNGNNPSGGSENLRNSMYEGDIGTIRRVGHGMFNFPENTLGDDYRAVLNALGNRDETAGIFRRSAAHVLDLARGFVNKYPDLNGNLAAQLKAVENWAGWQDNPQEAFTEAFENYMLFDTVPQAEGESELAWGFHGLKGVLLSVYRNNPQQVVDGEVRALLDASILAGEIVENTLCFDELLEGLHEYAKAGLAGSGSNWDIVHIAEKARAATIEAQSKYIARRVKELRKEWKAIATQAAGQLPCYKFGRRIKEEGGLDRDMMLKLVGQKAVTRLRELGLMAKRGTEGVNPLVRLLEPDARAIAGSAQELAEELIKWGKEKDFIDDYVERETRKWMEAQAWNLDDEALANSELIKGLDTLAQSITQENAGMEARQAFKTEAQERLSRMTVKELLSYDNSLRSARSILADITRELGHKSPDGVALLQHIGNMRMQLEMCRQLAAFRKDIEGTVKLISRAARMKRGTIYDKYHDALIELARYFGISGKAVDEGRNYRRDLYQAYVKECEEGGVAPAYFPDIVFTTDMADYRNLSYSDMAALHDFAQWLYGEGRDRVKELASSRARRIQDTVEQSLAAFAGQRHSHTRPPTEDMTPKEKALHWLQNLRASFTLLWRTMGESCPAMKERHRQLALAATRELILQQEAMKPLTESINKLYDIVKDLPIEKDPRLPAFAKEGDRFYDSRNYREWTKERVIMAVLYMGTESGRQRLRAGFGWTGTEEDVDARLNAIPTVLPAAALKEINKIWQTVGAGALTRETKAMFLAENHYELKTLPPVPMDVTSADGERVHLTGGYIPLRYLYSNRKQTVQMGYTPLPLLSSPSGTFARCAVLPEAAPLRLCMNTLIADVVERAHYATHTSLLREIFAAVSDRRFAEEFGRTQGWERYEAMLQMLRHIGNPAREGWDSLGALEKWGRTMMVSSALMANLSSAGMQLTSLTVGAGELGKYWVKSVLGFLAHPVESVEAGRRVSAMLRNRADMQDIDLHSAAGRFSENKLASLQKHFSALAYSMMRFIDVRVAAIDFNAAYAKALDEGMSQEDALAYAEDFLARAQGSTRAMDAMPFQLNTWGRLMTPFITAVAAQANVTAHDLMDKDSGAWRKVQNLAFNMLIPTILAGVVRYGLKGGFGGDEDKRDEALMAAIREMLGQPFAGIPIARDVADLLIGMATGQGAQGGMDVSLLGAYNNLLKDAFNAVKAGTQGDWDYAGYLACDAVSKAFNMPVFVIYERYRKILEAYGVDAYNPRKELKDK